MTSPHPHLTETSADHPVPGPAAPWRHLVPATAGVLFALAIVVGPGPLEGDFPAVLAAATVVYIGAAVIGSRRSAWLWFLATGVPIAADQVPDGAVDATAVLLALAAALLAVGVVRLARDTPADAPPLPLQLLAVVVFGTVAGLGAVADSRVGAVLVAAGLVAHAAWDWHHHRTRQVVTRPYAMFCLTLDATLAGGLLLTTF